MVKAELDGTEFRAIAKKLGISLRKNNVVLHVPTPMIIDHLGLAFNIQN